MRARFADIPAATTTSSSNNTSSTLMANGGGGGGGGGGGMSNGVSTYLTIACLKNNGNTCYLNSILYVLRFTSRFVHNLHHVAVDVLAEATRAGLTHADTKAKSSSLGRNVVAHYGVNSSRSNSTKDLLSAVGVADAPKNKVLMLTERLHEVFVNLHELESGAKRASAFDAYLPYPLLQALRDTSSIFCGNEQQDVHELLLYIFDNIRDTCNYLEEQHAKQPNDACVNSVNSVISNNTLWTRMTNKIKKQPVHSTKLQPMPMETSDDLIVVDQGDGGTSTVITNGQSARKSTPSSLGYLMEDFRGETVRRTKCLECESVTVRKEHFYEIPVPIHNLTVRDRSRDPSEIYREACLAPETLRGENKYYCSDCRHLNEAERSVAFECLPNVMILQQKRFMHTAEGFEKVNAYMPTPLTLACFCETCINLPGSPMHEYKLSGVVMHVGSTMQSGHYKAYVTAKDHAADYANCTHVGGKTAPVTSKSSNDKLSSSISFFIKPNKTASAAAAAAAGGSPGGRVCASRHCCGVQMRLNLAELPLEEGNVWLECNDDKVRPIGGSELEEVLAYKSENSNTPYLLFYEKVILH